jgi:hypothetical protein
MINKFIKNKIKPKLNGLSNISEIHKTPESSVSTDVGTGVSSIPKKPMKRKDRKYIVFKV